MNVSVIICTYNRCESLARTLESLATVDVPAGVAWDVLVVDNNSTDRTAEVARQFEGRLPLRYCFEPEQGLSHARNRGVRETRSDLVLFTDDDVRVDCRWLAAYAAAAQQFPEAAYFGGRIEPYWPQGKPRWLKDEGLELIAGMFVRFNIGPDTRLFTEADAAPIGASMAFRARVFPAAGTFRPDLGVCGGSLGRGEDTEYFIRLTKLGHRGVYVADALCFHEVEPRRTRLGHAFRYGIQSGAYLARTNGAAGGPAWRAYLHAAWFCVRGIRQQFLGRGDRFRQCVIGAGIEIGRQRTVARLNKTTRNAHAS